MQRIADIVRYSRKKKIHLLKYFYCNNLPWSLRKHEFNALVLLTIESPLELCRFLKKQIVELEAMINAPDYKHFTVSKKRGGLRSIHAPGEKLKKIQKQLYQQL